MLRQSHFVTPVLLLLAQEFGFLEHAGVEVEATETSGSEAQLSQLLAGECDVFVSASDNLFIWNEKQAHARIVAQIEGRTPLTLFARHGFRSLAHLDGCRFSVDAPDNGFAIAARKILAEAGVEVQLVEHGGVKQRFEALIEGRADATLLGPPFDALASNRGLNRLASIDERIPGYPGQSLIVSRDVVSQKREELVTYLSALARALGYARSMTAAEGSSLLIRAGFPDAAAVQLWASLPGSLVVDPDGIRMLAAIREELDALPRGYRGPEELLDNSLVPSIGATS